MATAQFGGSPTQEAHPTKRRLPWLAPPSPLLSSWMALWPSGESIPPRDLPERVTGRVAASARAANVREPRSPLRAGESFDPQPVFSVPVLDRQFGIAVEAIVIGADLRFDPARFVAQQQNA